VELADLQESRQQEAAVHDSLTPANYQEILDYVAGKGPKPSREEATAILLALADNAATAKRAYNAEIVKDLFGNAK